MISVLKTLFLFLLHSIVFSSSEYYPSDLIAPPIGYYISNPDSILSASDFESINKELESSQKLQIGVLIIKKISSSFLKEYSDQDKAAHEFAKKVFDKWEIGNAQTNNGLLLFISTADRKMRIVTGAGAKEIISDSKADKIFDEVKSLLKKEDYAGAIHSSINEIKDYINPSFSKWLVKEFLSFITNAFLELIIPIFFLAIFCVLGLILSICNCIYSFLSYMRVLTPSYWKRKAFTKKINKLKEKQTNGKLNKNFISETCGICLEEFNKEKDSPKTAKNFVILVCGHNFHKNCLEEWFKKKNSCPYCKQEDPTRKMGRKNEDYEKINEDLESSMRQSDFNLLERMVMIQRWRYPQFYDDYSFSFVGNAFRFEDLRLQENHFSSDCNIFGGLSSVFNSFGSFGGGSSIGGGGGGGSW